MKKVLFWCTLPFAVVIGIMFLPIVALNIVYEKFQDALVHFDGWCHDTTKRDD